MQVGRGGIHLDREGAQAGIEALQEALKSGPPKA